MNNCILHIPFLPAPNDFFHIFPLICESIVIPLQMPIPAELVPSSFL